MKKLSRISTVILFMFAVCICFAQEQRPGGTPPQRSGRDSGRRGGFMRGPRTNPRAEAEKKLKELYPAEYAEILKLREEAEKKLQELAKKANITLPALPKSFEERMEELKKKYPKEMAEIEALQKTDRRAAFAKLRALMEKDGIAPGGAPGTEETPPPVRENPNRKLREVQRKYPEEWKKIQALRRTDPAKARQMTRELMQKYDRESGK